MNSRITIGSKVSHDFSEDFVGTVMKRRRHKQGYNYLVEWSDGSSDWYKREVLVLI